MFPLVIKKKQCPLKSVGFKIFCITCFCITDKERKEERKKGKYVCTFYVLSNGNKKKRKKERRNQS